MQTQTSTAATVVNDIKAAIDLISGRQVALLQANKVYTNAQLKAGEKDLYYKADLEKKQLIKMLDAVEKVVVGFNMYNTLSAANAKEVADKKAADDKAAADKAIADKATADAAAKAAKK